MLTENRARHPTRPRALHIPADRDGLDLLQDHLVDSMARPGVAGHPRLLPSLLSKSTRIASC